jgi:hypothetical protein
VDTAVEENMPDPMLTIYNCHVASCGAPPILQTDPDHYTGYFENRHGEQLIFRLNHATGEATLRLGDTGWENVYPVVEGRAPGLELDFDEAAWLRICSLTATGR